MFEKTTLKLNSSETYPVINNIKNTVNSISQKIDIGNEFFVQDNLFDENYLGLNFQNNPSKDTDKKYPFLLYNSQDKLDASQFTLESFTKRFSKDYVIKGNDGNIEIYDKSGKLTMFIEKSSEGRFSVSYPQKKEVIHVVIPDNQSPAQIDYYSHIDKNGKRNLLPIFKKNQKYARITSHGYVDEKSKNIIEQNFDEEGKVKSEIVRNFKDGKIINYTEYKNGIKKELVKDGKFLFVKDIQNLLKNTPKYAPDKLNILNDMIYTSPHVQIDDFIMQYEKITGNDYFSDIVDYFGKDKKNLEKYSVNFITRFFENKKQSDVFNSYILNLLKRKIKNSDNSDKIGFPLIIYCANQKLNPFEKFPNLINEINQSKITDEIKKDALKNLISILPSDNNIIKTVMNSDLKYLFNENNSLYTQTKTAKTIEEKRSVFIDIKRLLAQETRLEESGNKFPKNSYSPLNGKIDLDFKQSNSMGDCWLLAGLLAIKDKENGRNILNSLISFDKEKGIVKVNLKGVNKTYEITKQEIEDSKWLSSGDGDIRAIEIAVDKYITEQAKNSSETVDNIDIDGNLVSKLWKILLGNGKTDTMTQLNDSLIDDFNNKNEFYSFSFSNNSNNLSNSDNLGIIPDLICADTKNKKEFYMFSSHAYSVVCSDKEYVYFRNPHDSSRLYKISRDSLKGHKIHVHFATTKEKTLFLVLR